MANRVVHALLARLVGRGTAGGLVTLLAVVVVTLLASTAFGWTSFGLGKVGSTAQPLSSQASPSGPVVCASVASVLAPASTFGTGMNIAGHVSQQQLPLITGPFPDASPTPEVDRWYASELIDNTGAGTGSTFNPLSPTPLAQQEPSSIFQVIENVFTTTSDSVAVAQMSPYLPGQGPEPQVDVNGTSETMQVAEAASPGLGTNSLVTVTSLPGSDVPTAIQYVVQEGSTLFTMSFIGGQTLTPQEVRADVISALGDVTSACPGVGGS